MKNQLRKLFIVTFFALFAIGYSFAQESAIMNVESTNKGILIPRMTTTQRTNIVNPAKGLLVFDNTINSFWFYNGDSWVNLAGSVAGPQGPAGADGETGPKGDTGAVGATGPAGTDGADGAQGLKGDTGATGATGPKGDTGATGAIGPAGADGADGAQGLKGDTGATGATGPAGADGADGAQGLKGDTGATGATGPKGDTGATGAIGPAGADGADGAQGLKGDTGATGAIGPAGADGADGAQGLKGDTGATGAIGPAGADGADGAQGLKGDTGATGAIGPAGADGADGAQGLKGDTGATGATGPKGDTGDAFWVQTNNNISYTVTGGKVVIGNASLTTPGDYNLYVEDGILTEKIRVALESTARWADDAFGKKPSLKEMEKFIQENSHLIAVPSAKELVKKGFDLAEMDATLLRQIEWLWEHAIEAEKERVKVATENKLLKAQLELINKRLTNLEK